MNKFLKISFSLVIVILALTSCGGSDSNGSSSNQGSEDGLKEYAGKWELFQQGDKPGDTALFKLKIDKDGSAEVSHSASGFGYEKTLDEGSGTAYLSGNTLTVEITRGKSRGTIYEFKAVNGSLYVNGMPLTRKRY